MTRGLRETARLKQWPQNCCFLDRGQQLPRTATKRYETCTEAIAARVMVCDYQAFIIRLK